MSTDVTPTPSEYRQMEESITMAPLERLGSDELDQELLTLNMGPHHPATHGVLRLLVTLDGEIVRNLKPIIGYVHTGIEKTAEDKNYWKAIPVVERMDYLAYYFNAYAFCGATETLLELAAVDALERRHRDGLLHLAVVRGAAGDVGAHWVYAVPSDSSIVNSTGSPPTGKSRRCG